MRRHWKAALVACALCVFFAIASAPALAAYEEVGSFAGGGTGPGGSGSEDGQLSDPGQIAVNDATSRIYVADTANNRVQVFAPNSTGGEYESQVAVTAPTGLAIDEATGEVYVAAASGVLKFDSSLTPIGAGWTDPGVTGALAVDPSTGDLLVADREANLVRRFESDGSALNTFAAQRPISVAVTPSGQVLVVTSTGQLEFSCAAESVVRRFTPAGVESGTVGKGLTAPAAVAVDPDDGSMVVAARVNQYFCGIKGPEVGFFDADGTSIQTLELSDAQYATVPGLAAQGVGSSRVYVVTKSPANDSFGPTKIVLLELPPKVPPTVVSQEPGLVGSGEASLLAVINPNGWQTTYRFEYGTGDCSVNVCQSVPTSPASAGEAKANTKVSATVLGLVPGLTYHFRIVATNAWGTTSGTDRAFTAESVPTSSCANAAFRPGLGALVPDCRAYEQVSPVEKGYTDVNSNDVALGTGTVWIGGESGKLAFTAAGAYPDADANTRASVYLGLRGTTGWSTQNLNPPRNAPPALAIIDVIGVSEDGSHSLVVSNAALTPGAAEFEGNLYLRDNRTGTFEFIATGPATYPYVVSEVGAYWGSTDFSHVFFISSARLTPEATGTEPALYEWAEHRLTLVSSKPDGTSLGPVEEPVDLVGGGSGVGRMKNTSPVAPDGTRVFFNAGVSAAKRAYVREGQSPPRPLAISEASGTKGKVSQSWWAGRSRDGATAYIVATEPLVDGATENNLYAVDARTGSVTDLVKVGMVRLGSVGAGGPLAVSPNERLIYFTSEQAVAPGADAGKSNLYVQRDGSIEYIATRAQEEHGNPVGSSAVSPDGRFFAFESAEELVGADTGGHTAIYLYDSQARTLQCASCAASGAAPTADATLSQGVPGGNPPSENERRAVLNDGMVIFQTRATLLARDTNGKMDVYARRGGTLYLISSGRGASNSEFEGASDDGTDIYISTRAQLVPQDTDEYVDLYDARVNGGLASQYPPPVAPECLGEGCKGSVAIGPAATVPATSQFQGPGNQKQQKKQQQQQQKKKKKKKHKQHKKKHAKKKGRHHQAAKQQHAESGRKGAHHG